MLAAELAGHGRPGYLLGAALSLASVTASGAQALRGPGPGQQSFALAQGLIVQLKARPTLYLPSPSTGVDAVDVATGTVLWRNTLASVPLVAREDRLLALASPFLGQNQAMLVFIDTDSGKIVTERPPLQIPGWGPLTYLGGEGTAGWFALESVARGRRDFLVWHYRRQQPLRGATPPRDRPTPVPQAEPEDSGVLEVDLARATLTPTGGPFPGRTVKTTRDARGGYTVGPFESDGVSVTLVQTVHEQSVTLSLRRRRGGHALPDVVIAASPSNNANVEASADWRHVLGVYQVPGRHDPFLYDVTVYVAATGEKVGHLTLDTYPSTFVVWKRRLLYFFPSHVGLVDLRSGRKVFDRPVRGVAVSGPVPGAARHD